MVWAFCAFAHSRAYAQGNVTVTTLHRFTGTDGSCPNALVQASNGQLYGTSYKGGKYGGGAVFRLSLSGAFTLLDSFTGAFPQSPLIQGHNYQNGIDLDQKLYGTTSTGGTANGGVLFTVSPSGVLNVPFQFAASSFPIAGLTQASVNDASGSHLTNNFYGATFYGGSGLGDIYKYNSTTRVLSVVYAFLGGVVNGQNDQGFPIASLVEGNDGNFYGMSPGTESPGRLQGNVFKVTPAGKLTVLHSFNALGSNYTNANGGCPRTLIKGKDGNFYGATIGGGPHGEGTIFKLTPSGALTTLHNFNLAVEDCGGTSGLIQASDGNFYGTTINGGVGYGTIFMMTPAGALTILHSFSLPDQTRPYTGLIQAADGNLYGTTSDGNYSPSASPANGTIFELRLGTTITSAPSASAILNQPFTYQVTANDQPTGYSAEGLPAGLVIDASTGLISGFPGEAGTFTATLTVTNANEVSRTTLSLTVVEIDVPVITSALTIDSQAGTPISYQIVASNNPTGYSASGLPDGLSFDPTKGLITGTVSVAGTYFATLSAANAGGANTAALTINVAPIAIPVSVFTSPTSASAQVGVPFSFDLTATNQPTRFGNGGVVPIGELPDDLTLNPDTGLISGTPIVSGTFQVSVFVENAGGTTLGTLTLNIAPAATIPVVDGAATVSQTVVGDGSNAEITLSLSAAPTAKMNVYFSLKGSAVNGTDYVRLSGHTKIKPGKTSKTIIIQPLGDLGGAVKKIVKLTLEPGDGYTVGTTTPIKVKILAAGK